MKNSFIILWLLLCSFLCFSKKVPASIREHFTICSKGIKDNSYNKVRHDGYYVLCYAEHGTTGGTGKHFKEWDSSFYRVILYENGLALPYYFQNYTFNPDKDCSVGKPTSPSFEDIEKYGDFGAYIILNDTIYIQYIHQRASNVDKWAVGTEKYKIIDGNTLIYLGGREIFHAPETKEQKAFRESGFKAVDMPFPKPHILPAKFVPCNIIPPPTSWLLKEDWIWCK